MDGQLTPARLRGAPRPSRWAAPGGLNDVAGYPRQPTPSYELVDVDLLQAVEAPDIRPTDPALRESWARSLAGEATVYGLPSVYQYLQMHAAAIDPASPEYVGFNRFRHDRRLAGPGYAAFTTPNADTLYSHAWLDLSNGPLLVDVPAMGSRYFTLHFLDAYSNATHLGTRTVGGEGGRFLVAPVGWDGDVDRDDVRIFRVATPYVWVLMRIFVRDDDDLPAVHRLQDSVRLEVSERPAARSFVQAPRDPGDLDPSRFLEILDLCLRLNPHPVQEDALVYRLRGLGIGLETPLDVATWDPPLRAGVEAGHREALALIRGVRQDRGTPTATGWRTLDSGAYGFNYLHRAATNSVGLGATVRSENASFTTFVDAQGEPLDGSGSGYRLTLAPPPPVEAFWSLAVYDARTQHFHPNEAGRHVVNDQTPDLVRGRAGEVSVVLQRDPPTTRDASWLPIPHGPFYLVLRAYLPAPQVLSGEWVPPAVAPS